jgi:hypothetical protein
MMITKKFKHTVIERLRREPAFAKALLDEAMILLSEGEHDLAHRILQDIHDAAEEKQR